MITRRALDIEALLVWAYRDELSKKYTSSAEAIWGRIGIGPAHDSDQRTATSAQRYPHFGTPHPDAIVIEDAVSNLIYGP
jgi:hypothetical protein